LKGPTSKGREGKGLRRGEGIGRGRGKEGRPLVLVYTP